MSAVEQLREAFESWVEEQERIKGKGKVTLPGCDGPCADCEKREGCQKRAEYSKKLGKEL
jgi:hypothetical protein